MASSRAASRLRGGAVACVLLVAFPCSAIARPAEGETRSKSRRAASDLASSGSRFVIHISVDGLCSEAVTGLGPSNLPHFFRMRVEGAYTDNARTDYDYTITLPDHACQLTSRPVLGLNGHGVTFNSDDGRTLAQIHGSYVAGVFDVAHDHGLATGMYASKAKFELFHRSWNATNGAPDTVGVDNGRNKIDVYVEDDNTASLVHAFVGDMEDFPYRYSFIHFNNPDVAGHANGWDSQACFSSIMTVDSLLGQVFDLIDADTALSGKTWVVLTADHGGTGTDHSNAAAPLDYTIPFYVWGPGIPAGADLYALNQASRLDPAGGRPTYAAAPQPIRNGEAANVSLELLGLGAVPGSGIDAAQDLSVAFPGGLPVVTVTNPPDGATFVYPTNLTISASAEAGTGSIVRVEFFVNSVKVGEDATSPYTWQLNGIPLGRYRITARAVRSDGAAAASGVDVRVTSTAAVPRSHSSFMPPPRIYPNPFDRLSTIELALAERRDVAVAVYDVRERSVGRIYRGPLGEGRHSLRFDAGDYAPGLYFLGLCSGQAV